MRPDQRWFPTNMTERAAAFNIFAKNFGKVALDLGFTQDDIDAVNADNDVVQFLARTISATKAFATAVIAFQQGILLGDIDGTTHEFPAAPVITPPTIVPTGIFERLERLVRRIRVMPGYTDATGALLGIIPKQARKLDLEESVPQFKASTLSAPYSFEVRLARRGFSAFRVYAARNNSDEWEDTGMWVRSPAIIALEPRNPGVPEVIRVRVRMIIGNDVVGQYSDIQTVAVVP